MTPISVAWNELGGRIDDFLLRQLDKTTVDFPLDTFVPEPTWNRFDLGFKLLYLDALRGHSSAFADRIYAAHITAFSLGDMVEPGIGDKVGLDRFKSDFTAILEGLDLRGFDANQSLVPLARDGSLLNAGHRAACAIALRKPLIGVKTGLEPKLFDYRFFAGRGMTDDDLDAGAIRLIEAMPNVAVALIWPAAKGRDREVDDLLGPLVYRKSVSLSLRGGHNLLARVYRDEPWLGDPAKDYPGIRRKLIECFNGSDDLRVVIFDAPPDRDRTALKDKVRDIYGIAKSSIHMTDTHHEAIEVSRLLLNRNARHFMDHGKPMTFLQTRRNLDLIHDYLVQNDLSPRSVAVDTGMIMGLYGLRPPSDVDVVATDLLPPGPIEQHISPLRSKTPADILQDPALHFSWAGLTFVSLREVADLKAKRLAGRDREDLLLIAPLLVAYGAYKPAGPVKIRMLFFVLRFRRRVIRILFRIKIGAPLRRLYRKARGR
jgi:hypothetical protein